MKIRFGVYREMLHKNVNVHNMRNWSTFVKIASYSNVNWKPNCFFTCLFHLISKLQTTAVRKMMNYR